MANPTFVNPAWDIPTLIAKMEEQYQLPPGILAATRQVESGNGRNLHSGQADGSMQFAPATAKAMGVDPMDDAQAIPAAAKLWADNLKATGGDVDRAAMMYHGGPNTSGWGPKTRAYPGKLLAALGPSPAAAVDAPGNPLHREAGRRRRPRPPRPMRRATPLRRARAVVRRAMLRRLLLAITAPFRWSAQTLEPQMLEALKTLNWGLTPLELSALAAAARGARPAGSGTPVSAGNGQGDAALAAPGGPPPSGEMGWRGAVHGLSDLGYGTVNGVLNGVLGGATELIGHGTDALGLTHGGAARVAAARRDLGATIAQAQHDPGGDADTIGNVAGQVLGTLPLGGIGTASKLPLIANAAAHADGLAAAGSKIPLIARALAGAGRVGDAAVTGAAGNVITGNPGSDVGDNAALGGAIGAGVGLASYPLGKAVSAIADAIHPKVAKLAATMGRAGPVAEDATGNAVQSAAPSPDDMAAAIRAVATGGQGSRRTILAAPAAGPEHAATVTALVQKGVPIQEAVREADVVHGIGGEPTIASTTRAPDAQRAVNVGANLDTPEGQALAARGAANNAAAHGAVGDLIEGYGGTPGKGEAVDAARQALAAASDTAKANVTRLYKAADDESAVAQVATDNKTAAAQKAANAVAAEKAVAAARAQVDTAQDAYRTARAEVGGNADKARAKLLQAREKLSTVTANPPAAAKVAVEPPGYIDLSALRSHLDSPEMVDPTTDGLRTLRNGAAAQIDALSGGSGKVTAQQAEKIRQTVGDAYDTLGGSINHHVGEMKALVDKAMDDAANGAGDAYKTARAAHRDWAKQYDVPGVANLDQA